MSAINFPLTRDISSAANEVSSQNAEQLPTGGSGQSGVLRPDTVTLSAVFPPAPPVDAANFVQFQSPAAAPSLSQQEQLAQLNRVLEQLGINPQSISLDNRLALIKSANDPPALLNLVRTLGVLNQAATSAQISVLSANNLSNPAPREFNHKPQLRTNLKPSLHLHPLLRFKAQVRRRDPGSSQFPRRQAGRRHGRQSKLVWPAMRLRSSRSSRLSSKGPITRKTSPARPVQALFLNHR